MSDNTYLLFREDVITVGLFLWTWIKRAALLVAVLSVGWWVIVTASILIT